MCMCVITSAKSIWINKISLHFGPHWEETATDTQFTPSQEIAARINGLYNRDDPSIIQLCIHFVQKW